MIDRIGENLTYANGWILHDQCRSNDGHRRMAKDDCLVYTKMMKSSCGKSLRPVVALWGCGAAMSTLVQTDDSVAAVQQDRYLPAPTVRIAGPSVQKKTRPTTPLISVKPFGFEDWHGGDASKLILRGMGERANIYASYYRLFWGNISEKLVTNFRHSQSCGIAPSGSI
ncbi:hypothetical protein K432DRAFT_396072 [Lepidopterella palustris CBS 459.81]|uniref:Uncharacterized protein n=1 Tax=Lepidopterella palustris CBS 459.81 TaxID=1314670 RepID=A0A8E2E456_9PEZI|nr:hypothetical protein K432DRAFT_396072 [Lepidopterella palustris CBS 459.81]